MRFTNLTRQVGIGANSYLLEMGGCKFVVDAGMDPKTQGAESAPDFSSIHGMGLDAIFVSHAHQDHIGCLPLLTRDHPSVPVYMTAPTAELGDAMLHNSVNVMRKIAEETGEAPLFTHRGADQCAEAWQPVALRREYRLEVSTESVSFEMFDAGHILGSAGILFRAGGKRVFYTGDVNFSDQTLLPGAEFPEEPLDVLILETTRGDSPEPENFTRAGEEERFAEALLSAYERGGCVLIPVFAIGKTQEILALLYRLRAASRIRLRPVYIGGLSTRMTGIYDKYRASTPRRFPQLELFEAIAPFTLTGKTISQANAAKPHIYALSSGMLTEKTLSNGFARRVLEHPESSIFLVGYTDPDSPAGRLRAAGSGGIVRLDGALPEQRVACRVEEFNFSAHSDRESLRRFAVARRPRTIVLVHGDPAAMEWFRSTLQADLPDCKIIVPTPGQAFNLE